MLFLVRSALVALVFFGAFSARAVVVLYTTETANFTGQGSGGGFHGFFDNTAPDNSPELGIFANGATDASFAAFGLLTTTGSLTGPARAMQVGDSFSITGYISSAPPTNIGLVLRSDSNFSSFAQSSVNNEIKLQLENTGGWKLYSGTTTLDSAIPAGADAIFTVKMTSSTTVNVAISSGSLNFFAADVPMSIGNAISSFALYAVNSQNDTYWKHASLSDTGTVEIGSNANSTISGVIADGLAANSTSNTRVNSLVKNGGGITTLTAANTFSGSTTINAGTLSISADANLGAAPGSPTAGKITIQNLATLQTTASFELNANRGIAIGSNGQVAFIGVAQNTTLTYNGAITGAGGLVKNQLGTLQLGGSNPFTGGLYIDEGTVELTGGSLAASNIDIGSGIVNSSSAATLRLSASGGQTITQPINVNAGTNPGARTLDVTNTSGTTFLTGAVVLNTSLNVSSATAVQMSGAISGTGGILKTGTGSLTLSGSSSYTGQTQVNQGALIVSGSIAGSTALVANGATLEGTGLFGPVTIQSGGKLAPGINNSGALTTGNLAFSPGGRLAIDLGSHTSAEHVTVNGAVDVTNGDLDLSELLTYIAQLGDQFYLVLNDGTDAVTGNFTSLNGSPTNLAEGAQFTLGSTQFQITYHANGDGGSIGNDIALLVVPEPGTWAMLLGGFGVLVALRRFRRTRDFSKQTRMPCL